MAKKPSMRQRKAAEILMENKGKSVSGALLEAGFSPKSAKNPKQVTDTRTWQELMDEYLPKSKIARVHAELLEAEETVYIGNKQFKRPDHAARNTALNMAHKVHGTYAPEQATIVMRKFGEMTDEELAAAVLEAEKKVQKD